MKKAISLVLLVIFVTTILSGCSLISKSGIESGVATKEEATTIESSKPQESGKTTEKTSATLPTTQSTFEQPNKNVQIKVLGELYQLYNKSNQTISSLTLSALDNFDDINYASPTTSGIRCIFNLDSSISITPTSAKDDKIFVKLYPHQEDASYYLDLRYNDLDSNYLYYGMSKVYYLDVSNNKYSKMFTSYSIDRSVFSAGYYDLVFFDTSKPIAVVMIKVFGIKGIEKTKKNPKKLMASEIAKTRNESVDMPTKAPANKPKKKKK